MQRYGYASGTVKDIFSMVNIILAITITPR